MFKNLCKVFAVLGILSASQQDPWAADAITVRPAWEFTLKREDGKDFELKSLKGKNVFLVHFWASWCAPCIDELPELIQMTKSLVDSKSEVKIVLVSLDTSWKDANKILKDLKLNPNTISLLDPKTKVSDLYGSYQFPETFLVDKDFKIRMKWIGPQKWNSPEFLGSLDALAKK